MFFHSNKSSPNSVVKAKEMKTTDDAESPRAASAKITDRLNQIMEETSALDKNRSADLVPLTAEYEQMKHKLRALVAVVKKYKQRTADVNDTKFELAQQLAAFSKRSPIYDEVGNDVDEETSAALKTLRQRTKAHTTPEELNDLKEEYRKRQGTDILSMYGLYSFGAAQGVANDVEFQTHVVDYVVDWERIVTARIEAELKNVKELEGHRRHYEGKVEGLREKVHHVEDRGKDPSKGQSDKLERNEEKLKDAFTKHERAAGKLCRLIEAVTHEGYKDLYPLVKNYMKWEVNRIVREHDIAERLKETLESLNEKMGSRKSRSNLEEESFEKTEEPEAVEAGQ